MKTYSSSAFLATEDVLNLLSDEGKADAFLVAVVETAILWPDEFVPADITRDADHALSILARRARDRMALPTWEAR
jgi:hypothetical protein